MFAFLLYPHPICQQILLVLPSKCIPSSSTSDHHWFYPGPSHCISPRGYFNSFPLVSLLLRLFPVISILHGGLGNPVRTFRSCFSSAQHLSVITISTKVKSSVFPSPQYVAPFPPMLPFTCSSPPSFTSLQAHWYLAVSHAHRACSPFRVFHSLSFRWAWDAPDVCVDGSLPSFRPLLRCYLLSEPSWSSSLLTSHGPPYFPSLCYFFLRHIPLNYLHECHL